MAGLWSLWESSERYGERWCCSGHPSTHLSSNLEAVPSSAGVKAPPLSPMIPPLPMDRQTEQRHARRSWPGFGFMRVKARHRAVAECQVQQHSSEHPGVGELGTQRLKFKRDGCRGWFSAVPCFAGVLHELIVQACVLSLNSSNKMIFHPS